MPKYKLNNAIILNSKRVEAGTEIELTKKQAESYGPGVCEEITGEAKQKDENKKDNEKK